MRRRYPLRARIKLILALFFLLFVALTKRIVDFCQQEQCRFEPGVLTLPFVLLMVALVSFYLFRVFLSRRSLGSGYSYVSRRDASRFNLAPDEFDGSRIAVFGKVNRVLKESMTTKLKKKLVDVGRTTVGNDDPRGRYPVQRVLIESPALRPGEYLLVHHGAKNGRVKLQVGKWVHACGVYSHRNAGGRNFYGSIYKTNPPRGWLRALDNPPLPEDAARVQSNPKSIEPDIARELSEQGATGVKAFLPDESLNAGDKGEELTRAVVEERMQQVGETYPCFVYSSTRVPRHNHRGRLYEVDLLILSRFGLTLIEVKHWTGGTGVLPDGRWEQIPLNGERRQHKDILSLLERKKKALHQYLSDRGITLPQGFLSTLVVFSNPRAYFDQNLNAKPNVILLAELSNRLAEVLPLTPEEVREELVIAEEHTLDIAKVIATLPQWDSLQLHGGRILRGDIKRRTLPVDIAQVSTISGRANFEVRRSKGLLKSGGAAAVLCWSNPSGEQCEQQIETDHRIVIMLPGKGGGTIEVPLEYIERIEVSARK